MGTEFVVRSPCIMSYKTRCNPDIFFKKSANAVQFCSGPPESANGDPDDWNTSDLWNMGPSWRKLIWKILWCRITSHSFFWPNKKESNFPPDVSIWNRAPWNVDFYSFGHIRFPALRWPYWFSEFLQWIRRFEWKKSFHSFACWLKLIGKPDARLNSPCKYLGTIPSINFAQHPPT